MLIKHLMTLVFLSASVLFLAINSGAQKLTGGGKARETTIAEFTETFCVNLPDKFRVCKTRETLTDDWKPLFLIQKNAKTLFTMDANLNADSTTENFFAYRGDLNKDGKSEIVVADLQEISNGVGISYYDVHVLEQDSKQNFYKALTFPINEFGEKGNFIFDRSRNETLVLLTYWDWFDTLDRRRGAGFYLVGKWFRYRRKRLQPVFEKPSLARRYLNSFQELRGKEYGSADAPYSWLQSKNTHRFFGAPKQTAKLLETGYGTVKNLENDAVTIQKESGEIAAYALGCCPADYDKTRRLTIKDFGYLPQNYIYPDIFYDFSPSMVFEKVAGKKVKIEVYEDKYDLRYIRLWFLEK